MLLQITQKRKITCFYGDRLTSRAVAHEVGGYNIGRVVGAALQTLDLTAQIHRVAAVNVAVAVSGHGNVENSTATIPRHRDGISPTFLHSRYVVRSTGDCGRGRFKLLPMSEQISTERSEEQILFLIV